MPSSALELGIPCGFEVLLKVAAYCHPLRFGQNTPLSAITAHASRFHLLLGDCLRCTLAVAAFVQRDCVILVVDTVGISWVYKLMVFDRSLGLFTQGCHRGLWAAQTRSLGQRSVIVRFVFELFGVIT